MTSSAIIVAGFVWAVIGVVVAAVAAARGRPFWPWLLFSVGFWPLAIFHLIFLKPRIPHSGPLDDDAE